MQYIDKSRGSIGCAINCLMLYARVTTLTSSVTHPILRFKLRYASRAKGTLAPVHNHTSEYRGHCSINDVISRDLIRNSATVDGTIRMRTERLSENFVKGVLDCQILSRTIFLDCDPIIFYCIGASTRWSILHFQRGKL